MIHWESLASESEGWFPAPLGFHFCTYIITELLGKNLTCLRTEHEDKKSSDKFIPISFLHKSSIKSLFIFNKILINHDFSIINANHWFNMGIWPSLSLFSKFLSVGSVYYGFLLNSLTLKFYLFWSFYQFFNVINIVNVINIFNVSFFSCLQSCLLYVGKFNI